MYAYDINPKKSNGRVPLDPKMRPAIWLTHAAMAVVALGIAATFGYQAWKGHVLGNLKAEYERDSAALAAKLAEVKSARDYRTTAGGVFDWVDKSVHATEVLKSVIEEINAMSKVFLDSVAINQGEGTNETELIVFLEGSGRATILTLANIDRRMSDKGFLTVKSSTEQVMVHLPNGDKMPLMKLEATYKTPGLMGVARNE
jgi:hypothetical protein